MTLNVLVCDDEPELAKEWLSEIESTVSPAEYKLLPIPGEEEFAAGVHGLICRRNKVREGQTSEQTGGLFDDVDILVIDYDLLHVEDTETRHTGEGIARLARAFSTCGLVVVLNQYPEAQFDLSLKGHIESHADLNVDAELIGAPGLWTKQDPGDFRPWHWPLLSDAAHRYRERVKALSATGALQAPVLATIGMTEADAGRLSDGAFGFLGPDAESFGLLAEKSFLQFIEGNSVAADPKDGAKLVESDPAACARIAASRVAKWLERDVLAPQDVLVDLPHLVQRFPFLLRTECLNEISAWNALVAGDVSVLQDGLLPKETWFDAPAWLGCPALWWQRVEDQPQIADLRMKFDYSTAPDFVFLEDASMFAPLAEALEFRAGFHNEFDRRFIKSFAGLRYAPRRRLAFAD